jgi:hypothetical protein
VSKRGYPRHVRRRIDRLLMHLDVENPNFSGTPRVKALLNSEVLGLYIQSWVLPDLKALQKLAEPDPKPEDYAQGS